MSAPESSDARKEIQRVVGRNLLNFQRVEFLLKHLLGRSTVLGDVSDLVGALKRRQSKVSTQMLGLLAHQLFDEFLVSSSEPPPDTPQSGGNRSGSGREFAFAATITINEQHHAEWKERMAKLVKDRNWLVHQFLETFPPDTLDTQEGCQRALDALNQQHGRIREELEALKWLIESLEEMQGTLRESLHDPKFRRDLFGTVGDQNPS